MKKYKIKFPYGDKRLMTPREIETAIAICKCNKVPISERSILAAHVSDI